MASPIITDPALLVPLLVLKAADFAARKHRDQRRKDTEKTPYINHPLGTAYIAANLGECADPVILQACILHDTVEDTDTTPEELVATFGERVAAVVAEVTDDKTLPKDARKRAQIEHAPTMSSRAKLVKLCDKLYNLRDLIANVPPGYTVERVQGYCVWSRMVVAGLRGTNSAVEQALDDEIFSNVFVLEGQVHPCCPADIDEKHVFPTT